MHFLIAVFKVSNLPSPYINVKKRGQITVFDLYSEKFKDIISFLICLQSHSVNQFAAVVQTHNDRRSG